MAGCRAPVAKGGLLLAGGLAWALLVPAIGLSQSKPSVPAEFKPGETLFNANCARCHGERGAGTSNGPPLVHKIYEPNHHGDAAFQRAAAMGVRAHHWQFGDMPKISGVSPADVEQIVTYIRWLQRQAGIF
jgi:cytochrome c